MRTRNFGARVWMWTCRRISRGPTKVLRDKYDEERRDYPQQRVGNIAVYGRKPFVEDVTRALAALADAYPYGYSLVQRYIHALEEKGFVTSPSISDSKHLTAFGAFAVSTTPEGRLAVTGERYARFLVRFAVERRRILASIPVSERAAIMSEKKAERAMSLLLRARGF